jgi:Spy/CpxP family protein refolding chaperone
MKKLSIILLIVIATLLLIPALSMAQFGNPPDDDDDRPRDEFGIEPEKAIFRFIISQRWWMNERVADELGLTEDQINQLEEIYVEYNKTVIQLRADVEEKRFDLDYMLKQEDFNVDEVEVAVDELMKAMTALEKYEIMTRVRILDVLTPEQREKLINMVKELLKDRFKNRKG